MFSLLMRKVHMSDVNPRAEKHGPEHVLAVDLKIKVDCSNGQLAEFHPKLKAAFYWCDANAERDLADQSFVGSADFQPDLVFSGMDPISIDHKVVGARVTIHAPVSKNDLLFDGCVVDNFKLDFKQGGTVEVSCRIITKPDVKTAGLLCGMIQDDIELSIMPPEADKQLTAAAE